MSQEDIRERFNADPTQFICSAIEEHVRSSELNRLPSFDGAPIFEEPLVGFVSGDDTIFEQFKSVVADIHQIPRDFLPDAQGPVSVISVVLPITRETKLSNRHATEGPSVRWNHTRWQGEKYATDLSCYLVSLLKEMGHRAVAPELAESYQMRAIPELASNWSQRHVAYAAGLGTFGLSDGLITPKGIAMRCLSIVTDIELLATPRPYTDHHANCLFYIDGSCRKCAERCPGGAISEQGHDKDRCRQVLFEAQRPFLEGAHGEGYIGRYAGCGLCQTGVPCESRIPFVGQESADE